MQDDFIDKKNKKSLNSAGLIKPNLYCKEKSRADIQTCTYYYIGTLCKNDATKMTPLYGFTIF